MNNLLPLLIFSISTSISPGPNNLMLLSSGLNHGIRKSLAHFCGICLGFSSMTLFVAIGLGVLFKSHPSVNEGLKYLGSAYMLYLAWKIYKSNDKIDASHSAKPLTFLQASLFQWLNPKAWVMVIGAISMFTLSTNFIINAIAICCAFLLAFLPSGFAWLYFGLLMQKVLKSEKHKHWFNTTMAILLVASVLMILFE